MNDYMKSLQKHFDRQEHNELDERIRCVREELRQDLGTESRRRLLHLLDAQNTLLVDSTLMSFTAGFKLAWGHRNGAGGRWSLLLRKRRRRTYKRGEHAWLRNAPTARAAFARGPMVAERAAIPRATIPRQVSGSLKMFSARHKQNARRN